MSRHYLSLLILSFLLLFTGCGPTPVPPSAHTEFAKEDEYTLIAYDALINKRYDEALEYFDTLYAKTNNPAYLSEALQVQLYQGHHRLLSVRALAHLKANRAPDVRMILIESLKKQKRFAEAIEQSRLLLEETPTEAAYILAAEVFFQAKKYRESIEHYKEAYELNPSNYVVDKIAEIFYLYLKESDEAIRYYETHLRFHGCNKYLCQRLASLHAKEGNIEGVISAYKRIYWSESNELIGRKVIDLYLLKNDYSGLQAFLEKSHLDDTMLLKLLRRNREFDKAADVALRLYNTTGEIDYLAQHTMFRFESGDQKDRELIQETISKLREVIKESHSHVYLNYLGYLLIDYDIDVEEGMELVNQALSEDPGNISYLDSLAWGYYKQARYAKAYEVIRRVRNTLDDPVVKEHYNKIKKRYDALPKN